MARRIKGLSANGVPHLERFTVQLTKTAHARLLAELERRQEESVVTLTPSAVFQEYIMKGGEALPPLEGEHVDESVRTRRKAAD